MLHWLKFLMLVLVGGEIFEDHFVNNYIPCQHALGSETVFYLATIVSHFAAAIGLRVCAVG